MLIAARSSHEFAFCSRAMAMARSKCTSAVAASGACDISSIFPAVRWISASHHFSLVASAAVMASPISAEPPRIAQAPHGRVPNAAKIAVSKMLLASSARPSSRRSTFWSRPKHCRPRPIRYLGSSSGAPSKTGNLFLRPERLALGRRQLPRRNYRRGYMVSRHRSRGNTSS
jgi:hypothetical protein